MERGMKRWNAPTRKAGSGPGDAAEEEVAPPFGRRLTAV